MRTRSFVVFSSLLLAGVAGVAAADTASPRPRGTYLVHEARAGGSPMTLPSVTAHAAPTIIYMNRMGGIYTPGDNDARTNHSTIPGRTSQVQPWTVSAAGWAEVMDCMREQFAAFNVVVTDVDPGNVPHIESVVAGYPQDVGMGSGVGGVSPFTDDCGVIPNSIVFTFARVYGTAYRDICETAAQEVSHSFGLDHEYECRDPMTYLSGCGDKSFQDTAAPCGEYSARECWCGGTTQNSVAMLRDRLGPRNVPPVVAITEPADGATVAPGFAVAASASDSVGALVRVELWVDGALAETRSAPPWAFTTDGALADGAHVLEVRAIDDGEAMASDEVAITVARSGGGGGGGGSGSGDGSGDGDGDGTIVGGCATAGGTGGALALVGLALAAIARRKQLSAPPRRRKA